MPVIVSSLDKRKRASISSGRGEGERVFEPLRAISRDEAKSREGGLSLEESTKFVELLMDARPAGEASRDDADDCVGLV